MIIQGKWISVFLLCFGDIQPYVFELRLIRKKNDLVFEQRQSRGGCMETI